MLSSEPNLTIPENLENSIYPSVEGYRDIREKLAEQNPEYENFFVVLEVLDNAGVPYQARLNHLSVIFEMVYTIDDRPLQVDTLIRIRLNKDTQKAEAMTSDALMAIEVGDENLVGHAVSICNAINVEVPTHGGRIVYQYQMGNRFMYSNEVILFDGRIEPEMAETIFYFTGIVVDSFYRTLLNIALQWELELIPKTDSFYLLSKKNSL